MIVETESVVLHAMNYRDTSKIVTLYSRKFGKIKVIAKGARNPKTNKFGSSLEPMTLSSVVLYKKEHRDLHLLSKSEIVTPLSRLQESGEKMFTGLSVIELVNMMMHDEEEDESVFLMIAEALKVIDVAAGSEANVLMALMVKLFQHFGFGVSFERCVKCQRKTAHEHFPFVLLRLSDGKIGCPQCVEEQSFSGSKVSGDVVKALALLQGTSLKESTAVVVTSKMRQEIFATLQAYLRYHSEGTRTLKSLSLLYSIQ